MNLPTLALDFVITVHITTCKCRQTIAEVQLSCRVNEDTGQTRERKIHCQAKSVRMHTVVFSNKPSSGGLTGGTLSKVGQGASLRHSRLLPRIFNPFQV